jgi:hypothetical protein
MNNMPNYHALLASPKLGGAWFDLHEATLASAKEQMNRLDVDESKKADA